MNRHFSSQENESFKRDASEFRDCDQTLLINTLSITVFSIKDELSASRCENKRLRVNLRELSKL